VLWNGETLISGTVSSARSVVRLDTATTLIRGMNIGAQVYWPRLRTFKRSPNRTLAKLERGIRQKYLVVDRADLKTRQVLQTNEMYMMRVQGFRSSENRSMARAHIHNIKSGRVRDMCEVGERATNLRSRADRCASRPCLEGQTQRRWC
jgi:hypothetical protein